MKDMQEPVNFNIEAEQQVLGCLLVNNSALAKAADLEARHFHEPVHRDIFQAIHDTIMAGRLASPVTMKSALANHAGLNELGGAPYLVRLGGAAISAWAISDYADLLRALWAKRELARIAQEALERCHRHDGGEATEIADALEADLTVVQRSAESEPISRSFLAAMTEGITLINQAYQGGEGLVGISTGLECLDDVIGGLAPGRMYVLAGRPGMGKSALALSIAIKAALRGDGALFASLEMPEWEIANRFFSQVLAGRDRKVPYSALERGRIGEDEFRDVIGVAQEMEALPIEVSGPTIRATTKIRAAVKRAKGRLGEKFKLVVIDYLQKLQPPGNLRDFDRINVASDFCKQIAAEFNVPVLALAQLSRAVETRENKRPVLSDLRGSGEIEQDADVVMFAYRDSYYLSNALKASTRPEERGEIALRLEGAKNNLEIIVAKQRGGSTGVALAHMEPEYNMIRDRVAEAEPEGFL